MFSRQLHRVFAQCWRARLFLKKIYVFQNDFRYQAKAPGREALASDNLALSLIFFSFLRLKSLKIFTIFENFPADRLKVEKNLVYKGTSSRYFQFCVFFLYLKFGLMNFFFINKHQEGQICLTVQRILGNFTEGKAINFTRTIPIFVVAKHYVMEQKFAKIGISASVDFRICRLLAVFRTVFSFLLTSFSGEKAYEYYGCSCWKSQIQSDRNCNTLNCFFTHLFR